MSVGNRREFLNYSGRFDVFRRFGEVNARIVMKAPKADLRLGYKKALESSLAAALLVAIVTLRLLPVYNDESRIIPHAQEIVQLEDIEQTRQEQLPPPPPRHAIPIEVPADETLEDVTIASTELDLAQELPPPGVEWNEEEFFVAVEEMPQIIGGMEAVLQHLVYPDLALRADVSGTVFVLVYVDEKGNVVKTEVAKGIGAGCDEAAQRAIEQVKFTPGKQRGKPLKVRVMIPMTFQICV